MTPHHSPPPVPLTVITGFLGVGKTTLLKHILQSELLGPRVALIVNDFGKVDVDSSLIRNRSEEMLQLKNGCICCSLQQNLADGLAELLKDGAFDRLVMETSGVTSLENLMRVLDSGLAVFRKIRVDRVVTVVDTERFVVMNRSFAFVNDQAVHADTILMNRCDQVSDEDREKVRRLLVAINPMAEIVETRFCVVDPALLGLGGGAEVERSPSVPSRSGPESGHDETRWFTSRIVLGTEVPIGVLVQILNRLPEAVCRIKGFCRVGRQVWSVQRAGGVVEYKRFDGEVTAENVVQIVAIGAAPIQIHLVEAFRDWDQVEVIEDSAEHDHHAHGVE